MFVEIISGSGACFGILLSIHLFLVRANTASTFLGVYLLSLSIQLLEPLSGYAPLSAKVVGTLMGTCAFIMGPALYIYCRMRVNKEKATFRTAVHFIPAATLLALLMISPSPQDTVKASTDEVVLYAIFVLLLFSYMLLSLKAVLQKNGMHLHIQERMQISFVRMLVYSSLVLFVYSLVGTIAQFNGSKVFLTTVQVLLNIVIIVIALLNTEGLERRQAKEWVNEAESA
jgi:hypothetical protein